MCVKGHHVSGVMCLWVITWVGSCMGGTHLIVGPPILGRVPYERRRKLFTYIPANLFFPACISFYRCFETFGPPIRKILVFSGMLPCLAPSWPQIMQIRISFRSRSDLVLDADHALDFLPDLAFQACISFDIVLDKSGA